MPPRAAITGRRPAHSPEVIQGAIEGVPGSRDGRVELKGQWFRIADKVGLMPLMRFAHAAAEEGVDASDMEALAAIYDMLRDCIHDGHPCNCGAGGANGDDHRPACSFDAGDWKKFERHAIKTKAEEDDMLQVVKQVIAKLSARPTQSPGGSSSTSPGPSATSTGSSSPGEAAG